VKSNTILILAVSFFLVFLAVGLIWLMSGSPGTATAAEKEDVSERTTGMMEWQNTSPMNMGKFIGQVAYSEEKEMYFLQLRGARFPFKASPILAQEVELDAKGDNILEKNTALLHGILGPKTSHVTLLMNPDEEDEVTSVGIEMARYIQMVNSAKFAGVAYTKAGGKMEQSVKEGLQIQTLEDATTMTPKILIKGPKSGATRTRVSVLGDGKVIVEGKTYEDLYKAAGLVGISLLKMLCGDSDCPDASSCATGGECGCG